MAAATTTPSRFPAQLIGTIHCGNKPEIAVELALSGIGAGVVIYHGIRADGSCTCGDLACPNAGKHPDLHLAPRGVRSATRNPRLAWQWFNLYPHHNLALALGPDLAAGDWDPRNGADLNDLCGLPKRTMAARTGGGGLHRLIRVRPSWGLTGCILAPGVELRTGNQAIVIERSKHRSGGAYEWIDLGAPIMMLPKVIATALQTVTPPHGAHSRSFDPHVLDDGWITQRLPSVTGVRKELLRGKYRGQARLLLAGEWEAAGHPSQSEAEYNLVLLVSGITDDQDLWLATLLSSGLGKRDREGTRRDDGHGSKLMRQNYIASLFARVAARRAELRQIGDPNLALARTLFQPLPLHAESDLLASQRAQEGGDVIDAELIRRGRPRGAAKVRAAQTALIRFLASKEAVWDRNGYIRVPMGEAAQAMDISRDTLLTAVKILFSAGVVDGPPPQAYKKRGHFAKDRYLRLATPAADALTKINAQP